MVARLKLLKGYCFITALIIAGCASSNNTIIIHEIQSVDSLAPGEPFEDCYRKVRQSWRSDTVLSRLSFPFRTTISHGSGVFSEEVFRSVEELKQTAFFNRFFRSLRTNLQYSYEYKTIYAGRNLTDQTLKLVFENTNSGFRFINVDGHWYLNEYVEELAFF